LTRLTIFGAGRFLSLSLLLAGCTRPETNAPVTIGPRSAEPEIRIGLGVGLPSVTLGGGSALAVTGAGGTARAEVPPGSTLTATSAGGAIRFSGALSWTPAPGESLAFSPIDPTGFVTLGPRTYRGTVILFAGQSGLTVVNRLGLESYLAGVVSAEMGRRDSAEEQALMAQAVVSRTYATKNRGRWNTLGFDLYATVSDQVYGGVSAETPLAWRAVTATAGQVVMYGGAPIDAFFFSTCGGRTARGTEVFSGADRPYLVSVEDADPSGAAYCRISPRFDWRNEWSGEGLRDILRESIPATLGTTVSSRAVLQSVRIGARSPSGRVARLTLAIDGRELSATGPAVRQVLRPARGELLRSSIFTLSETMSGGHLTRLVAEGHGAGHGVGLCQWGAVGRARAGQRYAEILAAYFPNTEIERQY
jgi:stage II sporulation protein D